MTTGRSDSEADTATIKHLARRARTCYVGIFGYYAHLISKWTSLADLHQCRLLSEARADFGTGISAHQSTDVELGSCKLLPTSKRLMLIPISSE